MTDIGADFAAFEIGILNLPDHSSASKITNPSSPQDIFPNTRGHNVEAQNLIY
jgi:hypothetical protein